MLIPVFSALAALAVAAQSMVPAQKPAIDAFVAEADGRADSAYRAGDYAAAAAAYEDLMERVDFDLLPDRKPGMLYNLACCHALLGREDEALGVLEAAVASGWGNIAHLGRDTDLDSIRETPRFRALVEDMERHAALERRLWSPDVLETPFRETLPVEERIAGLSRLWSEVSLAFAYFDQVPELDWNAEYLAYLPRVMAAERTLDYYRLLAELTAKLEDGHTMVIYPRELYERVYARPGLLTSLVDTRVVVTEIRADDVHDAGISIGDEVRTIDGVPVHTYAAREVAPTVSASTPQDRELRTYGYDLLRGDVDTPVTLELVTAAGASRSVSLGRIHRLSSARPHVEWRVLDDGVGYLAIHTFNESDVDSLVREGMDALAGADGLIIDIRKNGGGSSGWWVMRHLVDECKTSAWSTRRYVPLDRARGRKQSELRGGWGTVTASARDRRFDGPVALLVGPRTFSAAEDLAAAFAFSKRGVVVGQPTGGSTGQPLNFKLPGGGRANVCAKRDTYPDGSPFVGVGILPDVEVHPTVNDIRAGVDRALERAREIVLERS